MFGLFGALYDTFIGALVRSDAPQSGDIFDLSATTVDGKEVRFSEFKGKVLLIVNTASKCGFTGQYAGLEALHKLYSERGLVVLGFPSNDFMSQEPGGDDEIKHFCELNYGVTFPLFKKAPVTGSDKQPIYRFLTEQSPGPLRGPIRWNFEKFLINRDGTVVARWRSFTTPDSNPIRSAIELAL